MRIDQTMFPAWSAAATLVGLHGQAAVQHTMDAIHSTTVSDRLDDTIRAVTSFDHVVDNASALPIGMVVPRFGRYVAGYDAAREALLLIVGSGLVPAAGLRVGRQSLLAGRDAFMSGVAAIGSDTSRYGTYLAAGWLNAAAEDATNGAQLLQPAGDTGDRLLAGIDQVRAAVAHNAPLDAALVKSVGDLFAQADSELAEAVAHASQGAPQLDAEVERRVMAQTDTLLRTAARASAA